MIDALDSARRVAATDWIICRTDPCDQHADNDTRQRISESSPHADATDNPLKEAPRIP